MPLVPLDAAEPLPRLRQMLDIARPGILLDATGTLGDELLDRRVVAVDRPLASASAIAPRAVDPEAVSSMFFTSGSTGTPKAVVRTGRDLAKSWRIWEHPRLLGPWTHSAVFAPLNFVAGNVFAVQLPALGRRATLIDLEAVPPSQIPSLLERSGIDCMAVTPSLVRALHASLGGRRLPTVRHVMTFGEGLDWSVVSEIRRLCAEQVTVQSLYAASEAAGVLVEHSIGPEVPAATGTTPLGVPLDPSNVRLEPLDGSEDLYELVVVGDVVEKYEAAPELTARRFGIGEDGRRYWRSGDLVSVQADGLLHFRGRRDDMVKVNGRLIEPAEIEAVLRSVAGVRDAVVHPQDLDHGRLRLVAHIECEGDTTASGIRRSLMDRLPHYLIPAVLVRHKRLPLTDRGKVDRNWLRERNHEPWRDATASPLGDSERGPERGPETLRGQVNDQAKGPDRTGDAASSPPKDRSLANRQHDA